MLRASSTKRKMEDNQPESEEFNCKSNGESKDKKTIGDVNVVHKALRYYSYLLKQRPVLVKSITR